MYVSFNYVLACTTLKYWSILNTIIDSGSRFHAWMVHGMKEFKYALVLADGCLRIYVVDASIGEMVIVNFCDNHV